MVGQGGKTESSSLDSINEVCKILGSQSEAVVKIITEDVLKKKKLKPFVDHYLKSTDETLNFFNTVEKCVEKAKINQRLIRVAIERLETESLAGPTLSPNEPNSWLKRAFTAVNRFSLDTDFEGRKKNKYAETLEKLKKVKAMEDPFGDEFETQYESVYQEQVMLLVEIRELQVMLEKKLKNAKIWRGVGLAFLMTTLLSRIVLSIVGLHGVGHHGAGGHTFGLDMTHSHDAVLTQVNEILSRVIEMTKKLTDMLKDYEKALKTRKDLSLLTGHSTKVNIEEMETIKGLVDALITRMSSILETDEVVVEKREEEAVRLVMQEIIKNVEGFAERIEEVGANVAKCSKSVVSGRDLVLEHIANQLH